MNCKNCNKELNQFPHKRAKTFCNSTCRSNFWQKEQRKMVKSAPKKLIFPPPIKKENETEDEKVKRWLTKKPTLDQIKAQCPKELTGFERSEWIVEQRIKYGV